MNFLNLNNYGETLRNIVVHRTRSVWNRNQLSHTDLRLASFFYQIKFLGCFFRCGAARCRATFFLRVVSTSVLLCRGGGEKRDDDVF